MKQTWHSMSRSVSTCLLIAHLGFFYACLDIALWHWYDLLYWLGLRMSFFLLGIVILFLPDYFAHFICVDSLLYVVWLAVLFSLACILSWSSFEHDVCIIIRPDSHSFLRGHEWYILYSAWLYVAWLPFFCMIACCLSMWVAHLSPYFQLSWFRSFLSSRFSL